jgi:hypothetical protein
VAAAEAHRKRASELDAALQALSGQQASSAARERELATALAGTVPRETHATLQRRVAELEHAAAASEARQAMLEETAAAATRTAEGFRAARASEATELTALRHQLRDLHVRDGSAATLGQAHAQLVALQLSEATAVQREQRAADEAAAQRARADRLERAGDAAAAALRQHRQDAALEQAFLRATVQALRLQAAGAVPGERLERAIAALREARARGAALEAESASASNQQQTLADQVAGLEERLALQAELVAALQASGGQGAAKLAAWHQKMADLRVSELHLTRALQRERDQVSGDGGSKQNTCLIFTPYLD